MKLNKLTAAILAAGMSLSFSSFAATLSMNDDTNTISGLDNSQMLTKDNGNTWVAYTDSSQNNFPGTVTVTVAEKDNNAINSVDYDPTATYGTTGTIVRYNGYYWKSQWWVDPGMVPGSDSVWLKVGPIQIQNLATFSFTPYTGQKAADLQKQGKDKAAAQRKVIGYFPEWGVYEAHNYFTPDKIDFSQLTHLNYGFAVIKDGEVIVHDTYKGPDLLRQLDKLTEQNNVTNMVSVGGWNNSEEGVFEEATKTDDGINKLADSMIAFMQEWGFDGIDVDWEYPDSDTEKTNFTKLIQTLRSKLDTLGLQSDKYFQLSAAVTTNHNNIEYINPEVTAPLLDSVNVMAYDIHGAFDPITGHNAPLYANSQDADQLLNVASTMQEYSSKWHVPKSKLMMGIPFYGRGWGSVAPTEIVKGLPGLFASGSATVHGAWDDEDQYTGTNPYYLLKQYSSSADYTRYWDPESQVPYLYNAKTQEFLTYDDPESIQKKVAYINQQGYGGAIIWDISGDTPEHELGEIVDDIMEVPLSECRANLSDFGIYLRDGTPMTEFTITKAAHEARNMNYSVYQNGKYYGKSQYGTIYDWGKKEINEEEGTVTASWGMPLKVGDLIELSCYSNGVLYPLEQVTVTEETLAGKKDMRPEIASELKEFQVVIQDDKPALSMTLTTAAHEARNKNYSIQLNGKYIGKSQFGSISGGQKRVNKSNDTVTGTWVKELKAGDTVRLYRFSNSVETTIAEVVLTDDILKDGGALVH
ncbi:glycosyl hydrolase family 18 protein [Citrobacter werkmanii]|uniref:glycosyl hydrolase family 18 protein n=1 Tax=Citrobacter werkmanii TaxID=67827 RepID=UPI003CED80A0